MATIQTFTDKTGAADKSIGFDFQYYYFLDKLLQLKMGQARAPAKHFIGKSGIEHPVRTTFPQEK